MAIEAVFQGRVVAGASPKPFPIRCLFTQETDTMSAMDDVALKAFESDGWVSRLGSYADNLIACLENDLSLLNVFGIPLKGRPELSATSRTGTDRATWGPPPRCDGRAGHRGGSILRRLDRQA